MTGTVTVLSVSLDCWTAVIHMCVILCHCGFQEARKAQLENHEPEDEEEDMDMDKDTQDSGQCSLTLTLYFSFLEYY